MQRGGFERDPEMIDSQSIKRLLIRHFAVLTIGHLGTVFVYTAVVPHSQTDSF